ncbi:MAG: lipopolysaccharide biosynthesis protein [Flavobacteriales bacterium]
MSLKPDNLLGLERWRSFWKKGSFSNDLAWLGSSKILGFLIGVPLTPILTRLYTPDLYGQFAFFNSILSILALTACLRFPLAFIIPEKEEDFERLFRGSFIALLFASTFFLLIGGGIWVLFEPALLKERFPFYWLLLIGPGVFLYSLQGLFINWNVRLKTFRRAAPLAVVNRVTPKATSILLAYGKGASPIGLLYGEFFGKALYSFMLWVLIFKKRLGRVLKKIEWEDLRFSFQRFRNYPLYILPGNFLNMAAQQVPLYGFAIFFSSSVVGVYAMAGSMLNIPFRLLVGSVQPVMSKRLMSLQEEGDQERIRELVREYYAKVFWGGIIPVIVLFLAGPTVFSWIFGEEWVRAGAFASLMAWPILYRSMASPFSAIYRVLQKEHNILILNIGLFLTRLSGVLIGVYYEDPLVAVASFSVLNVLLYQIHAFVVFRALDMNAIPLVLRFTLFGGLTFAFAFASWTFLCEPLIGF